jgi:hypothetical protein
VLQRSSQQTGFHAVIIEKDSSMPKENFGFPPCTGLFQVVYVQARAAILASPLSKPVGGNDQGIAHDGSENAR